MTPLLKWISRKYDGGGFPSSHRAAALRVNRTAIQIALVGQFEIQAPSPVNTPYAKKPKIPSKMMQAY